MSVLFYAYELNEIKVQNTCYFETSLSEEVVYNILFEIQ